MPGSAIDDPAQQLGQGLHLQATTIDLDPRYHPWSALAPSYPYHSPLGTDGVVPTDSLTSGVEDTSQHLLLEAHTATHHFRSMHLRAAPHPARHSPPNVSGMHRMQPSPILGSDPTQDPTTTNTTAANAAAITMDPTASQAAEMYAHIALGGGQVQLGTNTAQSLALSLDGSPSWNSAMTPMLSQQLDHLYPYQVARLGPPPRQASSQAHSNSHSTTGHHLQRTEQPSPQGHQQQQQPSSARSTPSTTPVAHRYSQELRRQQEDQLRRIQLQQQAAERERRASEEEQFMMHMSEAFHQPSSVSTSSAGSGRPSPPHLHPDHLQQQQHQELSVGPHSHGQPFYAAHHQSVYVGDMVVQGLQDGDLDRLALDMGGSAYGHQQGMDHRAYRLVDGPLHPLGLPAESRLE